MKKSTRRRPELEPLETMLLMSTAHPAAPATPTTLVGTFPLRPLHVRVATPGEFVLTGSGNLAKIGRVQVDAVFGDPYYSSITILSRKGYVVLVEDESITLPAKGASASTQYVVSIAGEGALGFQVNPVGTVTGTVTITSVVAKNGKASYTLKLS